MLLWARSNGLPWDTTVCKAASAAGNLEVLQRTVKDGCPWNEKGVFRVATSLDIRTWVIGELVRTSKHAALFALAGRNYAAGKQFMAAGGLNALAAILGSESSDPEVLEGACIALRQVSFLEDNHPSIMGSGAVEAMVEAMRRHASHAELQKEACTTLIYIGPATSTFEHASGVAAAILEAMKSHPDSEDILCEACGALWNMLGTQTTQDIIHEEGGIEAIFAVMEKFPLSVKTMERCCGALQNLAMSTKQREAICAQDGVQKVLAVMNRFSEAEGIQERVLNALNNFSVENTSAQVELLSFSIVPHILQCMGSFMHNPNLLFGACGLLANLSNPGANAGEVQSHGPLDLVLTSMEAHEDNMLLQWNACEALHYILDESAAPDERERALMLISAALVNFPDSHLVQLQGNWALSVLVQKCGMGEHVVAEDCVTSLVTALETVEENGEEWLEGPLQLLTALLDLGLLEQSEKTQLADIFQAQLSRAVKEGDLWAKTEILHKRLRE